VAKELSGWAASSSARAACSYCGVRYGENPVRKLDADKESCTASPMAPVDPWTKAADCERAIRIRLGPLHRVLDCACAEEQVLSDDALAAQI
jgi:hypothetical protein